MTKKVVIIGGVAGGASTAARLRRLDEHAEIIMFERGGYISFANCGLPYYIGGVIKNRDALLLQTPEAFNRRFNVDVRINSNVININRDAKVIKIENLATGDYYEESYDVLVLSPGSTPFKPKIEGSDAPNIFTLWNIPDTDAIKSYVVDNKPKRAAVIGGGFIGIEMAENLADSGIMVSLIEKSNQVMAPIDLDMAAIVHNQLADHGVQYYLRDGVDHFEYNHGVTTIYLESGKTIDADLIMLSIGVRPQSELAKAAGLEVNSRGGIIINDKMQTSDPNIYALGDAVEVVDFNTREKTMIPLAGPANKQGRIVANIIAGLDDTYQGTQGTSIAKVFDLTVANSGLNEKQLERMGKIYKKDYHVAIIHSKNHAGYYPGTASMTLKLIFEPNGKILGVQGVGYDGVDKRIDVIATVIRFGGTVDDLKQLELAYAPPFGSAKDPVNMIGFVADNILTGNMGYVNVRELDAVDFSKTIVLDVRTKTEYALGNIAGAKLIPVDELRDRLNEIDASKDILIYCAAGLRGYIAARILKQNGFKNVTNLLGGYTTYKQIKLPCETACKTADCDCTGKSYIDEKSIKNTFKTAETGAIDDELDACGLQCPGPIMQVYKKMNTMAAGKVLKVTASDSGFSKDILAWTKRTGNILMDSGKEGSEFFAIIKKGGEQSAIGMRTPHSSDKAMIVFSDDLDKAIATFIIANGAAAMGRKVTLFFTFWGINIVRKPQKTKVKKDALSSIFSLMMPKGTKKLGLSKMNMFGMGPKMIRHLMKKHGVDSLESLLQQAMDNGVTFVVCNMSMELLGIKKEELMDGVEFGGVASFLNASEDSDTNLFI